jgi:hypothetical protein
MEILRFRLQPHFCSSISLIQDHPTLPDFLPRLLSCSIHAAHAVGYSRVIRWILATVPAFEVLLASPIQSFLFRPLSEEEWNRYTDKLAIFPAISGADIRFAVSHPSFSSYQLEPSGSSGGFHRRQHSSRPSMLAKSGTGGLLQQVGEDEGKESFDTDDESLGSLGDSYAFSYGMNY